MKTIKLGKNGVEVSALGFGCMRMSPFARFPYPPDERKDDEAVATIEAALDAGVTFFDTGDFYGMGHNEALVGRAIKGRRDRAFISVKNGVLAAPGGRILGFDGRPNAVKNFAYYTLQRLGTEVIDLYQPARVDPAVPIEETVGAIADLIKEGWVRYLGVSEVSADLLRRANSVHSVTAIQVEYSLATRFIERELLPTARELGVGVVAHGAVAQGLLTGAIKRPLAAGDGRNHLPRFSPANLTKNLKSVAVLEQMAAEKGATASQLAVAWLLSRGNDILPLVGMSSRSRLPENLAALNVVFTDTELTLLEKTFAPGAMAGDRLPPASAAVSAS